MRLKDSTTYPVLADCHESFLVGGKLNSKLILKLLSWLLIVASIILMMALTFYFQQFHGEFSPEQDVWGQFGDFFGGTINPLLSFLTLIALVFTVALQVHQLEIAHEELQNSKEELKATREELKRSANAQQLTAEALEDQAKYASISAKLTALRASLEITDEQIEKQRNFSGITGSQASLDLMNLQMVKESIIAEIMNITNKICPKS